MTEPKLRDMHPMRLFAELQRRRHTNGDMQEVYDEIARREGELQSQMTGLKNDQIILRMLSLLLSRQEATIEGLALQAEARRRGVGTHE